MIIDFQEITCPDDFEKFCELYLKTLGYKIIKGCARGADRGVDIICEATVHGGSANFRWLVSCKHFKKNVGQKDDGTDINKLQEHQCNGFFYMYSSGITTSRRDSIEAICKNNNVDYKIVTGRDIESDLLKNNSFISIRGQFFPKSHKKLTKYINKSCNCGSCPSEDLFIIYMQGQNDFSASVVCAFGLEDYCIYCASKEINPSYHKLINY